AEKHEKPLDEVKEMVNHIVEQGKVAGIEFNMDKVIPSNTRDAHRLLKLAYEFGLGEAVLESLHRAYSTEGKNVSDKNILLEIAKTNGIPEVRALEVINDPSIFLENVIGDFN